MKTTPYKYGKSPNPRTWQEAADALGSLRAKPKGDKLDDIIKQLKEKK